MPTELYRRYPGERKAQLDRKAIAMSRIAGLFEKQIEWVGPGDVNVDPRMTATVSGTQSAWDQSYIIQSITFVFDEPDGAGESGGFTMTIEASNDIGSLQESLDSTTTQPATGAEGDGAADPQTSSQGFDESGFGE